MYIMYVDESGDTGLKNSPTQYYILIGLIVHADCWKEILDKLIDFRRFLRKNKNLYMKEEIHAVKFINSPGNLKDRISRPDRIDILKKCVDWVSLQKNLNVITVCINKANNQTKDIFDYAWKILIQRFENTIVYNNFNYKTEYKNYGIVISDNTIENTLRKIVRRMRRFNPIPNNKNLYYDGSYNKPLDRIIEDPVLRDSANSYFHQIVDVICYCARQIYEPNNAMIKKGGHNFYKRLNGALIEKVSKSTNCFIVEK